MLSPKELHLIALKLELESCEHVISVLSQQQPNRSKTKEKIEQEIHEYMEKRDQIVNIIFEEEILVGDEHDATN